MTVVLEGHHSDRSIEAPKLAAGERETFSWKKREVREGRRPALSKRLTSTMAVLRQPSLRKAERRTPCHREVTSPPRRVGREAGPSRWSPTERWPIERWMVGASGWSASRMASCAPASTEGVSHVLQHRELPESVCQGLGGTRHRLNGPPQLLGSCRLSSVTRPARHRPKGQQTVRCVSLNESSTRNISIVCRPSFEVSRFSGSRRS